MAEVPRIDRNREDLSVDQNRIQAPGQPATLGAGTPSISRAQNNRYLSRRFSQRSGYARNFQAPLENAVRNMPVIGKLAHENLTSGDNELQEEYAANSPIQSAISGGVGAGAATPFIRGASAIGNMARHGILGAADAAARRMGGENVDPINRAATYAVGGLAGRTASTTVSPRGPRIHEIGRRTQELHARQMRDPAYNATRDTYINARVPLTPTFNPTVLVNTAARRRDAGKQYDRMYFNRLFSNTMKKEFPDFNPNPPKFRVKDLPDWARGLGAGATSYLLGAPGPHSVAIGTAALLYGPLARTTENSINRLMQTKAGKKYINNILLNPERRDLLEAGTTGTAQQALNRNISDEFQPYEALRAQIMGPRRNAP